MNEDLGMMLKNEADAMWERDFKGKVSFDEYWWCVIAQYPSPMEFAFAVRGL